MSEPALQRTLAHDADWRRLDARMLLVHPVNELVRFLPAVVGVFVIGRHSEGSGWWHLAGIGIPVLLGLLRYATTTFRIGSGQLELRKGLISRSVLTTPLDRVRTVEVTSSVIHRLLGLAKVQIGTGSTARKGAEKIELDSLALAEARTLREALLHYTDRVEVGPTQIPGTQDPETPSPETLEPTTASVEADETVLRLDPAWVRYAPLTTSGLVIVLGALAATSQFIGSLANDFARRTQLGERASAVPLWLAIPAGVIAFLVVISMLAMLGYVLANAGFTLSRDRAGRSYLVRRGLLTTRETSLDTDRIRGLEIHEPLGLRLAGAGRLNAMVTGVGRRESGSSPLVPPAPRAVVTAVGEYVLGEAGPLQVPLAAHGPAARRRRYLRALAPGLLAAALLVGFGIAYSWLLFIAAPVPLVAAVLLARDRYARLGHALTPHYLVMRAHSLRGRRDALQRTGIIGWNLRQSWFQRRAGLVTLVATTSAGKQGYRLLDVPGPSALEVARTAVPGLLEPFLVCGSDPGHP